MNIQSALAACRYEIARLVKSIVQLLSWLVIFALAASAYGLLRALHVFSIQTAVASGLIFLSVAAVFLFAKSRVPDRKSWIGVHASIVAVGIAAVCWVPQWSGYIVEITFLLFVITPRVLYQIAHRRTVAGYERAAAFYGRLVCLFHPSKQLRFNSSLLTARALGSTEEKVSALRALAVRATPEQFALLNCLIPLAQDDWDGVLAQLHSAGDTISALKWLEILTLGRLGRIDQMIITYASAQSILSASDLRLCRLYVLAFSGRVDAVRSLLSQQLRFVRPRNKAYWIFIASEAAGTRDEDARRLLESYVRAADETFRRAAQRYLNAGPTPWGVVLSAESRTTIAAIEKTLGKTKLDRGLRR
jgi:hypothetical protein